MTTQTSTVAYKSGRTEKERRSKLATPMLCAPKSRVTSDRVDLYRVLLLSIVAMVQSVRRWLAGFLSTEERGRRTKKEKAGAEEGGGKRSNWALLFLVGSD